MDITDIAKEIRPLIDDLAGEIFKSHHAVLVSEPITYIVPAVWGAKKDGTLTRTQEEIHGKVNPVVREIYESFGFSGLTEPQEFAVLYLVRGLVISKITYMIEALKARQNRGIYVAPQAEAPSRAQRAGKA